MCPPDRQWSGRRKWLSELEDRRASWLREGERISTCEQHTWDRSYRVGQYRDPDSKGKRSSDQKPCWCPRCASEYIDGLSTYIVMVSLSSSNRPSGDIAVQLLTWDDIAVPHPTKTNNIMATNSAASFWERVAVMVQISALNLAKRADARKMRQISWWMKASMCGDQTQ